MVITKKSLEKPQPNEKIAELAVRFIQSSAELLASEPTFVDVFDFLMDEDLNLTDSEIDQFADQIMELLESVEVSVTVTLKEKD